MPKCPHCLQHFDDPNSIQPERMLTLAEVAQIVGMGTRTVRRWISAGHLKAYYISPGAMRVREADLAELYAHPATHMNTEPITIRSWYLPSTELERAIPSEHDVD